MPGLCRHQILLVDNEAGIRDTLAILLTSAGYDVASAKDGFEALLHLRCRDLSCSPWFDVVFPRYR